MSGRRRQRGFVATAALYMLAARQEEAASAADVGLHAALENWDVAGRDSLPIGGVSAVSIASVVEGTERPRAVVTRLTQSLYWIASSGRAGIGTSVAAIRSQNLLVEMRTPTLPVGAALVARGDVIAAAGLDLRGGDVPPPGWTDCPPPAPESVPAIVLPPGRSAIFDDGQPIPNVQLDSAAALAATSGSFGRVDVEVLAARPTFTVAPGAILSPAPDTRQDCQLGGSGSTISDWGDPGRGGGSVACERFFPVVAAAGDLTLHDGVGQGLLMVAGRLRIEGPFAFHGVIFARDGISASGPGIAIYGAVLSGATAAVSLRNGGVIARSTCAVSRVAATAARAYPLPLRAWSELH